MSLLKTGFPWSQKRKSESLKAWEIFDVLNMKRAMWWGVSVPFRSSQWCPTHSQQENKDFIPSTTKNQILPTAWSNLEVNSSPEAPDRNPVGPTLWFQPWEIPSRKPSDAMPDFRCKDLWDNKWILFPDSKFIVVCYAAIKLIHCSCLFVNSPVCPCCSVRLCFLSFEVLLLDA